MQEEQNVSTGGKFLFYLILIIVLALGFVIGCSYTKKNIKKQEPMIIEVPTLKYIEVPVIRYTAEDEMTYYNVPLSHELQDYIKELCIAEQVPIELVLGLIELESNFDERVVSETNDFGLMQLNKANFVWLAEAYGITDFLDPKQNILCGVKMLSSYLKKYDGDITKTLVVYNMGEAGAEKNGFKPTAYSRRVIENMKKYE